MPHKNKILTVNDTIYKQCTKCRRFKAVDCFPREKNGLYHVRGTCKQCISKKYKQRYRNDPAYRNYLKNYSKKRYQQHRETIDQQVREWKRKHPGYDYPYVKKWQQENREYYRKYIREYHRLYKKKKMK